MQSTLTHGRFAAAAIIACVALAGCGSAGENVRAELKVLTKDIKGKIEPIPPIVEYKPFDYSVGGSMDPFTPGKVSLAARPGSGVQPDMDRAREPLEAFALEQLTLVGTVQKNREVYAVIKADGALYQVKKGGYVGENFGKVVKVSDEGVVLSEMIQDAQGVWSEREAVLEFGANQGKR